MPPRGHGFYTAAACPPFLDFRPHRRYDDAQLREEIEHFVFDRGDGERGANEPVMIAAPRAGRRAGLAIAVFFATLPVHAPFARAGLLEPRPGPIERPLHFVTADFDRDGEQDIMIAGFQSGALMLLLGNGDGTFTSHPDSPFPVGTAAIGSPTAGPLFLATADFNPADADSDNFRNGVDNCPNVYNPATLGVQTDANMNGVGDACEVGVKDAGGMIIATIDSDGDGVPDYDPDPPATLDNCPLLPNPGQEDTETATGPDTQCGTIDDRADLFGPNGLCGDLDDLIGDGVGDACAASPDLAIVESTFGGTSGQGIIRLRVNTGAGGLAARTSKITGRGPSEALLDDFDRDGFLDLVVSVSGSDAVTFFGGLANGEFGAERSLPAGDGPQGMAAADFNQDGFADLAVANRTAGTISLYLNDGISLPAAATTTFDTYPQPTVLLTGRIDGDACPDLVVLHQADGGECAGGTADGNPCVTNADCPDDDPLDTVVPVCEALSPAQGLVSLYSTPPMAPACAPTLAGTITLAPGQRPRGGVLADLDGNLTLDLALADFSGGGTGSVRIFSGAGDGTFAAGQTIASPPFRAHNPVALQAFDYDGDGPPDLGVLGFANNRFELLHNDGGLTYSVDPASPVSLWKDSSFLAVTIADNVIGTDLALLRPSPPAVIPLSGIGNTFFLPLPEIPLEKPLSATAGLLGDLREDNRPDILVVDQAGSSVSVLRGDFGGAIVEGDNIPVGPAPVSASLGNLYMQPDDFDRDGVPNVDDNCPARYNPPFCTVADPACAVEILCTDTAHANYAPVDCGIVDPVTNQCDSDGNDLGDHCQVLSSLCTALDTDGDTVRDYDPVTGLVDNCPFFPNATQDDSSNPDDGVGDLCDRGICESTTGGMFCLGGPVDRTCLTDADCGPGLTDIITVSPGSGAADGSLTLLQGDGSGSYHESAASPLTGFVQPSAALSGLLTLDCIIPALQPIQCLPRPQYDLLVVERQTVGDPGDDTLTVLQGDGTGAFTPLVGAATQGDPSILRLVADQPICSDPSVGASNYPAIRFRFDRLGSVVAVVQPETESIGIFMPGGRGVCAGGVNDGGECTGPPPPVGSDECPGGTCTVIPVLEPPPGHPEPLPVPGGKPTAAHFIDLNRDSIQDLLAIAREDGDPDTPSVVLYLGIGNGLFYTDPTLNPSGLDGDYTLVSAGKVTNTVGTYPDVILFDEREGAPLVLTNLLRQRADIDGSGRVDGADLAILARAFGAGRGEDFTILGPADGALDGTLLQSGSGINRVVVGSGVAQIGQDMKSGGFCSRTLDPVGPFYGLAVDIDLDGVVDGDDLALLSSLFGIRF